MTDMQLIVAIGAAAMAIPLYWVAANTPRREQKPALQAQAGGIEGEENTTEGRTEPTLSDSELDVLTEELLAMRLEPEASTEEAELPEIRSDALASPVTVIKLKTEPTRADRRAGRAARRARRKPGPLLARRKIGRYVTATYISAEGPATRCWPIGNVEEAFWLPGDPAEDPRLDGYLRDRQALPYLKVV